MNCQYCWFAERKRELADAVQREHKSRIHKDLRLDEQLGNTVKNTSCADGMSALALLKANCGCRFFGLPLSQAACWRKVTIRDNKDSPADPRVALSQNKAIRPASFGVWLERPGS